MSFNVDLMTNTEPYNKIGKDPALVTTASGTLKDECSLVDPVIIIEYAGAFPNANYACIQYDPEDASTKKYYFIKNVESYRTGLWRVSMHIDVLKTYASGILSSPAIVARSSNNFNMLLNDDHYYCQENPYIFTKQFPSGFDTSSASYVLALIGQASSDSE